MDLQASQTRRISQLALSEPMGFKVGHRKKEAEPKTFEKRFLR